MVEGTLFSFVGVTDVNLIDQQRGPILTAVDGLKPKNLILIATTGEGVRHALLAGAEKLQKVIKLVAPVTKVSIVTMDVDDPTDHNELYPKLRDLVSIHSGRHVRLMAAISSGTPSMQVCWILLAESGEVKLSLYRTTEAELAKTPVREVKLDASLPRIVALEEENAALKEIAIHPVTLSVRKGHVTIGDKVVQFSPLQFAYYRFFLERIKHSNATADEALYRMSGMVADEAFGRKIQEFKRESFPNASDSDGTYGRKKSLEIPMEQFRSNLTKLNSKLRDALGETLARYYIIEGSGPRQAKRYGIKLDKSKVRIH
jgi:hypothetical protein